MRSILAIILSLVVAVVPCRASQVMVGNATMAGNAKIPAPVAPSGVTYTITHHSNSTNTGSTAAATYTSGWTGTAGDWVVIQPGCFNGATATIVSATDNATGGSNTFSQATSALGLSNAGGWNGDVDTYYNLNIAHGGGTTFTITCPTGDFSNTLQMWEGTSSGGTPAFDLGGHVNSAAASTTELGPSLTTTGSKGLCVAFVIGGTVTQNPTSGNAYNAGGDIDAVYGDYAGVSLISTSAASYQASWTLSSGIIYGVTNACFK